MIKSLIDKLARKVSAVNTKALHSTSSPESVPPSSEGVRNEVLEELMKKLRERKEKDGTLPSDAKAKMALLELIMPEICPAAGKGFMRIDHKRAKEWAFATGEMVGILAGLSIKRKAMGGAIDEVASNAKAISKTVHEWVVGVAKQQGYDLSEKDDQPLKNPNTAKASAEATATSKAEAAIEAKRKIIDDLEMQAMLEVDAAVKVAFTNQVERMKKELELLGGEKVA